MRFRLRILLFCLTIFFLTGAGLVVLYVGRMILTFWFTFAFLIGLILVLILSIHPLLAGERKLSGKKIILLTFMATLVGLTATHSVWTIVAPRWAFSVSSDKSTYRLGEHVRITASLNNLGYVTHSLTSSLSNPVIIRIEAIWGVPVWFSSYHREVTEFTVPPHQSLERTFIWNQTNIYLPEEAIELGKYYIYANIPSVTSISLRGKPGFEAVTSINITSA